LFKDTVIICSLLKISIATSAFKPLIDLITPLCPANSEPIIVTLSPTFKLVTICSETTSF
jgi:hypothetical protein